MTTKIKIYTYKNCGTCKKATKWLNAKGLDYSEVAIRDTPPSKTELKKMLQAYNGEIKKLFNTAGVDYRELNMKVKLATLSDADALELLASRGNLIKRPFLLSSAGNLVGFKEVDWADVLG